MRNFHLRALYNVSTYAALEAVSQDVKFTDNTEIKEVLGRQPGSGTGKVYMLEQVYWVVLTPKCYFDDRA